MGKLGLIFFYAYSYFRAALFWFFKSNERFNYVMSIWVTWFVLTHLMALPLLLPENDLRHHQGTTIVLPPSWHSRLLFPGIWIASCPYYCDGGIRCHGCQLLFTRVLPLPLKHVLLEDRVRLYLSQMHQDPLAQGGHLIKLCGMNKHQNEWMGCFYCDLWNAWACGMPD